MSYLYSSLYNLFQQVIEQHARNQEAGMLTELVRDFLNPAEFYKIMQKIGIDFFCGVPDSLLKGEAEGTWFTLLTKCT